MASAGITRSLLARRHHAPQITLSLLACDGGALYLGRRERRRGGGGREEWLRSKEDMCEQLKWQEEIIFACCVAGGSLLSLATRTKYCDATAARGQRKEPSCRHCGADTLPRWCSCRHNAAIHLPPRCRRRQAAAAKLPQPPRRRQRKESSESEHPTVSWRTDLELWRRC